MMNHLVFTDDEIVSLVNILRGSDIQGSAARLVVGIEDKLIASVKVVQDKLEEGSEETDLEYLVSFEPQELNALVQMANAVKTKGDSARAIAAMQDKLEPAALEAEQLQRQAVS